MRGLQRVVSAKCKGKNGMPRGAGFWGGRPARKKPSGFGVREGSTSERVRHFSEAAASGVGGRAMRIGFFLFGGKKAEKREKT